MPAPKCSLIVASLLFCLSTSLVSAQELSWAAKMFDKQKVDFGVVARGAETVYRLKIKNIYPEDVHISNVRTTCGCSAATPSKTTLTANEEAYIEIKMDTERFTRRKDSNAIVTIDAPYFAEVRIPITAYIRTDVVLSPGSAALGAVPQGEEATKTIDIAYAGRADWTIKEVQSKSEFISTELKETNRSGGRVDYQLKIVLKAGAPVGTLREQLTLLTDDMNSPTVPILFEAKVESEFTVTPEFIALGKVNAGQSKVFSVVVRSRKPFGIAAITCESEYDGFKVAIPQDAKLVHVLPVTLSIPSKPGAFDDNFVIKIADREEPVKLRVYGEIVE